MHAGHPMRHNLPKEWLLEDSVQLLFPFKANTRVNRKEDMIPVDSPFEHIHKIASSVMESFNALHHEA